MSSLKKSEKGVRNLKRHHKVIMSKYFFEANAAWDAGNFYRAFRQFLAGAKSGDVSCQTSLGYFYDNGIGVARNLDKAFFWYSQAVKNGNDPVAAHNLALLYREVGDRVNAKQYFLLTVKLGSPESLFDIGNMLVEEGDFIGAQRYFEELLTQDPSYLIPSVRQKTQRRLKALLKNGGNAEDVILWSKNN